MQLLTQFWTQEKIISKTDKFKKKKKIIPVQKYLFIASLLFKKVRFLNEKRGKNKIGGKKNLFREFFFQPFTTFEFHSSFPRND